MTTMAPYRGLAPYRERDAALFFGRERECRVIAANLMAVPITLLYGPTGVGKSSLVHAGLVPELRMISRLAPETRIKVVTYRTALRRGGITLGGVTAGFARISSGICSQDVAEHRAFSLRSLFHDELLDSR